MPFDRTSPRDPDARRPSVAIVGGGISGLAAAWRLRGTHDVTLFETERRLGGHARTVIAGKRGDQPVDTGFIVFNEVNYPHLTALFAELDVPVAPSRMSFAASFADGLEYGLGRLPALWARRRNAADPRMWRMVRDILRFNARAREAITGPEMTIGALCDALGLGRWFRERYLLPFSGAIWSAPSKGILDFPAQALVDFFDNHALLQADGGRRWSTVRGGSAQYVRRVEAALRSDGVRIRLGVPVAGLGRDGDGGGWRLSVDGAPQRFDHVILAAHANVSARIVGDADGGLRRSLDRVAFRTNRAVLHSDPGVMPRRRRVWGAWNYVERPGGDPDALGMTYWMNALQPIPQDDPLFVTLNDTGGIPDAAIHDEVTFAHPVYDLEAARGRAEIAARNGRDGLWICGAWMRNGFHEDGFASAVDVTDRMAAALAG